MNIKIKRKMEPKLKEKINNILKQDIDSRMNYEKNKSKREIIYTFINFKEMLSRIESSFTKLFIFRYISRKNENSK